MSVLVVANVNQPPFINNLLPVVEGFSQHVEVTLVEPRLDPRCTPTGAHSPVLVPLDMLREARTQLPSVAVFAGGGLAPDDEAVEWLKMNEIRTAGIALSDPNARMTSLAIIPRFRRFYTQDPDSVATYRAAGLDVRLCLSATSPRIFHFPSSLPDVDVLYFGKWSDEREAVLATLVRRGISVRIHAHAGEQRWKLPTLSPLNSPGELAAAVPLGRVAIDFTRVDHDANQVTFRASNRAQIAALGGVLPVIENRRAATWLYEPDEECITFESELDAADAVESALGEPARLLAMGNAAKRRTLRDHDWRDRAARILSDLETIEV